jgi:hypothetical protein
MELRKDKSLALVCIRTKESPVRKPASHIRIAERELSVLPGESMNKSEERKTACQDAVEYGIDICQLEYLLTLTPMERLLRHDAALDFVLAAREAGKRYYGFDPRHPETP